MRIPVSIRQHGQTVVAEWTDEHATSSYGQPVLVVAGVAYGRGDEVPGTARDGGGIVALALAHDALTDSGEWDRRWEGR